MYEHISEGHSSLISGVYYNLLTCELIIYFRKYYVENFTYENVPADIVSELLTSNSLGKYCLYNIKNKFKLKIMTDERKPINLASDKTRYIRLKLDVTEINKKWLFAGKDGAVYLDCTLHMQPDGTVDKYGNLGFITQDVPKDVYKADKKAKGKILGNAAEFDFDGSKAAAAKPGVESGTPGLEEETYDELPF